MAWPSPQRNEAEKVRRDPIPQDSTGDEPTPLPSAGDSDEESWESLGSTRVIEGHGVSGDSPSSHDSEIVGKSNVSPTQGESFDASALPVGKDRQPVNLGDFQLVRKLGEGAMGAVYLAKQLSFDRDVALKVLFPHIAANPKLVERLYREGRVMGQLDHPNIVQAFGVGEDQGWHYIALEYIDGASLQKWLAKRGKLSIGDAVLITLTVARALEHAHNQGFVHRDIKPDNVLITRTGVVKVADLGMVKIDDEDMSLTQTGHAVGTPWYMPLEQAKNAKETDRRSDIYALGCLLYCALTGAPPFAGKTLLEVIQMKEVGTFPPARTGNPEVPERLDLVIAKMTAKLPKYRYQTCADLVKDLESLNLANPRLQLLAKKTTLDAPTPMPGPLPGGKSSHADKPVEELDPNIWYVRIKDPEGRATIHKLTTQQVINMLTDEALPPNAKASHHPRDGFRALPTYKEFQGSALAKTSKAGADQQSVRYRSIYKKIEEEQRQKNEAEDKAKEAEPPEPPWKPLAIKYGIPVGGGLLGLLILYSIIRAIFF